MQRESLDIENLDICLDKAIKVIEGYMNDISKEPVIPNIKREKLYDMISEQMPFDGVGVETVIDDVKESIIPYCSKIGNPKFLSWIITSPSPAGTIGEFLNIGLNQVPFCYKSGLAATVLKL